MKRILSSFVSIFLCFSAVVPFAATAADKTGEYSKSSAIRTTIAAGAEDLLIDIWNYINNYIGIPLEGTNEKLKKLDEIDDVKERIKKVEENTDVDVTNNEAAKEVMGMPKAIGNATSSIWDTIIEILISTDPSTSTFIKSGSNFSMNPLDGKFNDITNAIRVFAYSIVLVFFAVNLIEQSVKYEIFTMKGMLQIFGRLLVSKIIIDMSTAICAAILSAIGFLTKEVALTMYDKPSNFIPSIELPTSGVKLIGPLIDTIVATALSLVIMLIAVSVFVMTLLVLLKLVLRSFELTILVCTSPAFFACASSDVTKEYFKKFVTMFIQVALQTVFMVIALYIGTMQLASSYSPDPITSVSGITTYITSVSPNWIIMLAMCLMMLKPPKVLTNILK